MNRNDTIVMFRGFPILHKTLNLLEQLGRKQRITALVDPENTNKIKAFCDQLVRDEIPAEITVGEEVFEILEFLQEDEIFVSGFTMRDRARKMNMDGFNSGWDAGEYFFQHRKDIPATLRDKVNFVFPYWEEHGSIFRIHWFYDYWSKNTKALDDFESFGDWDRLVRLKK